jgi:hypothetical protein
VRAAGMIHLPTIQEVAWLQTLEANSRALS